MTERLYSAWFELQAVGVVVSLGVLYWLEGDAKNELLAAAAPQGRAAVARVATLVFGATSGRARLVREALRVNGSTSVGGEVDYRSSPSAPVAAPALTRVYEAEVTRLRRAGVLAALGLCAMLVAAGAMLSTEGLRWVGGLSGLIPLAVGARMLGKWRRSRRALEEIHRALPGIVAKLEPPRPLTLGAGMSQQKHVVELAARSGSVARSASLIFIVALTVMVTTLLGVAVSRMTTRVGPESVGPTAVLHVALGLLVLVLSVLGEPGRVVVDVAQRELVVVRRRLGVLGTVAVIPLEVVEGFTTRVSSGGRGGGSVYVVAVVGPDEADRLDLGETDRASADATVATLTSALVPPSQGKSSRHAKRQHEGR